MESVWYQFTPIVLEYGRQTRAVAVVTYSNQYDVVYICIVVTC